MTPEVEVPRSGTWAAVALAGAAAAETALVGWALTTHARLLFALGQVLLLAATALVLLLSRFLRYRRSFERAVADAAARQERTRLAEELHDVLGHELSLVALRAAAVQVSTEGETSLQAAELRAQVERVVLELRQTVELLREPDRPTGAPRQPEPGIEELAEGARAAGAHVVLDGELGESVPAPVRATAFRVAREALTNAVKHAPGSDVLVRQWHDGTEAHVQVENDGVPGEDGSTGSGLASLTHRVESLGGTLTTTAAAGRRTLHAALPLRLAARERELAVAHHRPVRATARWALLPLVGVAVLATGFYAWSTHDATLEQRQFDTIEVGAPLAEVLPLLPRRESVVLLTRLTTPPAGSRCSHYTDGNYPLGMAAYEVCHDGARVTRTTDLRTVTPR